MLMKRYSVLVPCAGLYISGGILRFERLGQKLKGLGHKLCFVPLTERVDPNFKTVLPVLSREDASKLNWDAVMIPGAGYSDKVMRTFSTFCHPKYGVRVQHVLNDTTRKKYFLQVNRIFQPDIVIFNNPHWGLAEQKELRAKRYHYLFGAVDTKQFYPKPDGKNYLKESWVIGGVTRKNPEPLIEALRKLPKNYIVKLFGPKLELENKYPKLFREGRLQLVGSLPMKDLSAFYHSVDCVVHTERFAGWANLVAESMACGLPVICTTHGTKAFATHGKNAIILDEPSPESIVDAVMQLSKDSILCNRLSTMGRQTMMNFSWDKYARDLLKIVFANSPVGNQTFCKNEIINE